MITTRAPAVEIAWSSASKRAPSLSRIRDKFAASRRKGMWMGGWAPLGYEVKDRKLVVNEDDAELVRSIFHRFLKTGSATILARQLIQEGVSNKYGKLVDKGILYKLLGIPLYRRGSSQGCLLSRRTYRHYRPQDLGQGTGTIPDQSAQNERAPRGRKLRPY